MRSPDVDAVELEEVEEVVVVEKDRGLAGMVRTICVQCLGEQSTILCFDRSLWEDFPSIQSGGKCRVPLTQLTFQLEKEDIGDDSRRQSMYQQRCESVLLCFPDQDIKAQLSSSAPALSKHHRARVQTPILEPSYFDSSCRVMHAARAWRATWYMKVSLQPHD